MCVCVQNRIFLVAVCIEFSRSACISTCLVCESIRSSHDPALSCLYVIFIMFLCFMTGLLSVVFDLSACNHYFLFNLFAVGLFAIIYCIVINIFCLKSQHAWSLLHMNLLSQWLTLYVFVYYNLFFH